MNTNPTTVRGWLETLPEPYKSKSIAYFDDFPKMMLQFRCDSLGDALKVMESPMHQDKYWWMGFRAYVCGIGTPKSIEGISGYNAAKAAYEAQERRKSEVRDCCRCGFTLPETEFEGFEQVCNDCLKLPKGDWVGVGPIISPAYQVKEVWESEEHKGIPADCSLITKNRLAELEDKAAKWDELMETLKRLKIC